MKSKGWQATGPPGLRFLAWYVSLKPIPSIAEEKETAVHTLVKVAGEYMMKNYCKVRLQWPDYY